MTPYVVFITAGEPETGLWCEPCLLPSVVRVPLVMITESGASDTALSPVELCTECGRQVPAPLMPLVTMHQAGIILV